MAIFINNKTITLMSLMSIAYKKWTDDQLLLSEKKALPSLVLACFIVYFALALMFYFDF